MTTFPPGCSFPSSFTLPPLKRQHILLKAYTIISHHNEIAVLILWVTRRQVPKSSLQQVTTGKQQVHTRCRLLYACESMRSPAAATFRSISQSLLAAGSRSTYPSASCPFSHHCCYWDQTSLTWAVVAATCPARLSSLCGGWLIMRIPGVQVKKGSL